jgi:holo-[acyl-carrier-protein] synthase
MIKCGIDTIEISRLMDIKPSIFDRFVKRVYTEEELKQGSRNFETLSGIFAAKEAVAKALGTGIGYVSWQDIEIYHQSNGEPEVRLSGNAAIVAKEKGLKNWCVSISHDRNKAIAMAIGSD